MAPSHTCAYFYIPVRQSPTISSQWPEAHRNVIQMIACSIMAAAAFVPLIITCTGTCETEAHKSPTWAMIMNEVQWRAVIVAKGSLIVVTRCCWSASRPPPHPHRSRRSFHSHYLNSQWSGNFHRAAADADADTYYLLNRFQLFLISYLLPAAYHRHCVIVIVAGPTDSPILSWQILYVTLTNKSGYVNYFLRHHC